MNVLSAFMTLPPIARAGIAVLTGGSLIGVLWRYGDARLAMIVVIGLAVVGLLLVGYKLLLKKLDKGKSKPFESGLADNASASPQELSDPSRRANLDALRRRFEEGVSAFKDNGKDLYSMPWYVLVGEPGSGKTEAIRHCNVGFPPGLQDELQGAGGTINMNWWFTNHAVILDTAGRLMFEEVAPGQTSEWREFLQMLRSNRINCPINGLLLVIPADSLIRDKAEELERKGSKIAGQLDQIQRVLGVRFPVFVVVTKCDLINGFREFFDDLRDPALQHQMMGWSNPGALDDPFEPDAVGAHLRAVQERLRQRRLALLADPVHTEDANGRRIDQVDALFAFPESFVQIEPRLRRYLEMIFVGGEWSSKPLFLRGIYLTSSMREGSALDADLAEALGVGVDSLPEGRVWERDSAYFLRDLFVEKVFKEKGLVTRASNARETQRRRQFAVLGAAAAVIVIMLTLTFFGGQAFARSVGEPVRYWNRVATWFTGASDEATALVFERPGVAAEFEYLGDQPMDGFDATPIPTRAGFLTRAKDRVAQDVRVPVIFAPVAAFGADLGERRLEAYRALLSRGLARPAADASRRRLSESGEGWSASATEALTELVRAEAAAAGAEVPREGAAGLRAGRLLAYALGTRAADIAGVAGASGVSVVGVSDWAFEGVAVGQRIGAGTAASRAAVDRALDRFLTEWSGSGRPPGTLGRLQALSDAVADFERAEAALIQNASFDTSDPSRAAYDAGLSRWTDRLMTLREARARIDAHADLLDMGVGIEALCARAGQEAAEQARSAFDGLLAELEAAAPARDAADPLVLPEDPQRAALVRWAEQLRTAQTELGDRTVGLARTLAADLGSKLAGPLRSVTGRRLYIARASAYDLAHAAHERSAGLGEGDFVSNMLSIRDRRAEAERDLEGLLAGGDVNTEAVRARCIAVLEAADRLGRSLSLRHMMDEIRATGSPADLVYERAPDDPESSMPDMVMSGGEGREFSPEFLPSVARPFLEAWGQAAAWVVRADAGGSVVFVEQPELLSQYGRLEADLEVYASDYIYYWAEEIPKEIAAPSFRSWGEFYQELDDLEREGPRDIERELSRVARLVSDALSGLPDAIPPAERDLAEVALEAAEADAAGTRGREARQRGNDIEDALGAWQELGPDPARASTRILDMSPREFTREMLAIYTEDPIGLVEVYWNAVFEQGLRSLGSGSQAVALETLEELRRRQAAAMPFGVGGGQSLTAEDAARLARSIRRIASSLPPVQARRATGELLGEGASTGIDPIDDALGVVRGDGLLQTRADRSWFDKLATIANWLEDDSGPLAAEIVLLPQTADGVAEIVDFYPFVEVPGGGRESLRRSNALPLLSVAIPADAPTVINFRSTSDGPIAASLTLPAPWGILESFTRTGQESQLATTGLDGVWTTETTVDATGPSGVSVSYRIGVRFSRPPPMAPSDWPKASDWPTR